MSAKDKLRLELTDKAESCSPLPAAWGRMAESLRRLPAYRQAKQVFTDPAPCIKQIRLNALMDGKELIMPSPSLKEGFYLLRANDIPFKQRLHAVGYKGLVEFGHRLSLPDCRKLKISFFVTSPLAWNDLGYRLGDGKGFFDLSFAVLSELQATAEGAVVCGVVGRGQKVVSIPQDPWDVRLDYAACENKIIEFPQAEKEKAVIFWEKLEKKRIKKITPLWQLKHPAAG